MSKALKAYLITSPAYYPPERDAFTRAFTRALVVHRPYAALLRGYAESADYEQIAHAFVALCREFACLPYVSADVALARNLGIGVHLRAHQRDSIALLAKERHVFYSAHSLNDMLLAQEQGAHAMTISPIFPTPNKPPPLGLAKLRDIMRAYPFCVDVFALGGIITAQHRESLRDSGVAGFASIRYFAATSQCQNLIDDNPYH